MVFYKKKSSKFKKKLRKKLYISISKKSRKFDRENKEENLEIQSIKNLLNLMNK